ncbi:hypothetical protein HZ326_6341 [Fusarium oxysporum f. sp. albedinis]|nr:hypothetical protein HZ326_6341 [Fusarium oxysporum f. sp. albedinis]
MTTSTRQPVSSSKLDRSRAHAAVLGDKCSRDGSWGLGFNEKDSISDDLHCQPCSPGSNKFHTALRIWRSPRTPDTPAIPLLSILSFPSSLTCSETNTF